MSVVPLTLTLSLILVAIFVVFFLREHARGNRGGAERDSLLPLDEERPRLARPPAVAVEAHDHDHAGDGDGCGCRTGRRAPCVGCLKRTTGPAA